MKSRAVEYGVYIIYIYMYVRISHASLSINKTPLDYNKPQLELSHAATHTPTKSGRYMVSG